MPLPVEDVVAPVGARLPAPRRTARQLGTLAAGVLAVAGCATTGVYGPDPDGTRVRLPPFVWWTRSPDGTSEVRNFLGFVYGQRAESAEPLPSSPDDFVVSRKPGMWVVYLGMALMALGVPWLLWSRFRHVPDAVEDA